MDEVDSARDRHGRRPCVEIEVGNELRGASGATRIRRPGARKVLRGHGCQGLSSQVAFFAAAPLLRKPGLHAAASNAMRIA